MVTEHLTEARAQRVLKKYSPNMVSYRVVLRHGLAVKDVALKLAKGTKADTTFLATASILHDIGRLEYPPSRPRAGILHGNYGADLLREEKLPKHALVCERHTGSGITKGEAKKLGMPAKEYMPRTIEQKIVCLADSLVFGYDERTLQDVYDRYEKELGSAVVRRTKKLAAEIKKAGSAYFS